MTKLKWIILLGTFLILSLAGFFVLKNATLHPLNVVGEEIDSYNGVAVYYNGGVDNVSGRHLSSEGYNYGLKYQCVEFVKRYYLDHLNHKMPNSYGHAKEFFNSQVADGKINNDRDLLQFTNPSSTKPKVNDLLIFSPTAFNQYGHVAIISTVNEDEIEIIQQNAGAFSSSRETFFLKNGNGKWQIEDSKIIGWLRKE